MDRLGRTTNTLSENTSLQNPSTTESCWKRCCNSEKSDGFAVISACFFVLTFTVTCSLVIQIHFGGSEVTPHGAVASDDRTCSAIGVHIIREGGTAVDATVASLLCLSVTHPHLVGPGGGGVMLVHDHKVNESKLFDFMVSFPNEADKIGVPGFLKGLEYIHHLYGSLPWKSLFQPAISLARDGFIVSEQLANATRKANTALFSSNFRKEFFPKGISPRENQTLFRRSFSRFLQDVSVGGADELHLLKYGSEVMEVFRGYGSEITVRDFHNYKVSEREVIRRRVHNVTIVTAGLPFGGLQVIRGLKLIENLGITSQDHPNELFDAFTQALLLKNENIQDFDTVESTTNTAFAPLLEELSQNSSQPSFAFVSDTPASQVSAVDTFDLYVTAVVGLGDSFGSGVMTRSGIIMNKAPIDPQGHDSFFQGKPLSPFTPLIASDTNNICGTRVILSSGSWGAMLQVVTQLIFRNLDMTSAIMYPRIAIGSDPNVIKLNDFDPNVKKVPTDVRTHLLKQNFTFDGLFIPLGVNGVSKVGDSLLSHSDPRNGGFSARLQPNPAPTINRTQLP